MTSPRRKPRILHLAVDYPDAFDRQKTRAIRHFVKANPSVDHVVIALTRTGDPRKACLIKGDGAGDPDVFSMRYFAPPMGILHYPFLALVARNVLRLLRQEKIEVDLVHAHKLCFEGLAGHLLSRWLKVPLACSVRGEAETKIIRFLPHYRPLIGRIIGQCRRLYYVSMWYRPEIEAMFPQARERGQPLPNFCPGTALPSGATPDPKRLVTILHLDIFRKKGLDRLLPAFARLRARYPDVSLDIVGRGMEKNIRLIEALIGELGLGDHVRLRGALPSEQLLAELPNYGAMCLPSHNETFGMVYVEALLSGVPILYSVGTGIDGFLDGIGGTVGVDPTSVDSIEQGLEKLLAGHAEMHQALVAQHDTITARFEAGPYIERYNRDMGLVR